MSVNSLQEVKDNIELLKDLIKAIRGQDDPRQHVTVITNPNKEHLLSSSHISKKQLKAIVAMKLISEEREEFVTLGALADKILRGSPSIEGWGTEKGIELAEAYAPRIASISNEKTETKSHWYSRKPKKEGK